MNRQSTALDIEVPSFGRVPVQVTHGNDRNAPLEVTHRPPVGSTDPRLHFKNDQIALVDDPKFRVPQYAVLKQKVLKITHQQLDRLLAGTLLVETSVVASGVADGIGQTLRSATKERLIRSDCPGPDGRYTVLLDWTEETSVPFPTLRFRDPFNNIITEAAMIEQENNYLVVSGKDGPNNPPPRPPAAFAEPLNNQPSDFRTATTDDILHYQQYRGQTNGPSVAVIDTGLKYNLLNPGEEDSRPDPYMYQDAVGQERRFTLAYQDQPAPACGDLMANNHLGYCAVLSYRAEKFRKHIIPLTTSGPAEHTPADVINSPFDDFRLHNPSDEHSIMDARHGTFVTAIIQQNGDDAPVVPVKAFDNVGFATLFDVLNAFNYVLQRCQSADIRVVNTSWIFGQDNPLLKEKIRQLMEQGVLVVAAAGNEGQTESRNLDEIPVYPACYSAEFPNVITVTTVRKTYVHSNVLGPKQDSIIGKALGRAIASGLFNVLEEAGDVIGAILPTAGYVAVENYSPTYVNVGVVSTFGYFRGPFWKSPVIRGSSYACAFVAGFVVRQLRTRPDLRALVKSAVPDRLAEAREELLRAMNGNKTDQDLKNEYVKGGYYLNGYAVD